MKKLSKKQLDSLRYEYRTNGYIVIKGFFLKEERLNLDKWAKEIVNWPAVVGKWLKYYELLQNNKTVLSRIENFVEYHPELKQLVTNNLLLSLLSDLFGEPVLFFKEKLNLKAPGAKGYTAHQDAPAFFDIDYDAITLLVAIDQTTITNGCLYFVKKGEGFTQKMLEQNTHNHALSKTVVNSLHWVPIECEPGDVMIFSSYTPHYSNDNVSNNERRALFLTFGKLEKTLCKTQVYYDKKRKSFPQDSEKIHGVDYTKAAKIYSFSSPVIVNLENDAKQLKK